LAKPIILILDDEAEVLNAIERDLRPRYGEKYRILKAGAGDEALTALAELRRRGSSVALLLVDQRMPGMSGTQFLGRAAEIYPEARKILLTAYADTQAAIEAINEIGLDHYLMKPWAPPEQLLYPILDSQLAEWAASAHSEFEGIRLAGALWSAGSHDAKNFLAHNQVPYHWLDVDRDQAARKLVEEANQAATADDLLPGWNSAGRADHA
jgi:thioredoxin reductase (NADPH)